jgi:hypothetical protein
VLLAGVLLALAVPAAVNAAGPVPASAHHPTSTPFDTNLLRNASFESAASGGSVPGWTASGDVHIERFGTRNWPSVAYSQKYDGGKQYLACGPGSGEVRQTVAWTGHGGQRDYRLKSRLSVNFGGTIRHKIRAEILITGKAQRSHRDQVYVLPITDSYKKVVVHLLVPTWAQQIEVTIDLLPDSNASKCHVVADSTSLIVYRSS